MSIIKIKKSGKNSKKVIKIGYIVKLFARKYLSKAKQLSTKYLKIKNFF